MRLILSRDRLIFPETCIVCQQQATGKINYQDTRFLPVGPIGGGSSLVLPVPACKEHARKYLMIKAISMFVFALSMSIWIPLTFLAVKHAPEGFMVFGFILAGIHGALLLRYGGRWVDLRFTPLAIKRHGTEQVELLFSDETLYRHVKTLNS